MNLGQIFSKPHYGMLLPPSYQEGKYAATGQIYRNPYFESYTAPGAWTNIYAGMWPAEVNPRTSLELYAPNSKSVMPLAQRERLLAANKANIADVKRYRNEWILKDFAQEQQAKINAIKAVEQQYKDSKIAQKALQAKKKVLEKQLKEGEEKGKKIIEQQIREAKIEASKSAHIGHDMLGGAQYGLGLRPDYTSVMPPSMKGELMDITGRNKNYVSVYDINNDYPESFTLGELSESSKKMRNLALMALAGVALYTFFKND